MSHATFPPPCGPLPAISTLAPIDVTFPSSSKAPFHAPIPRTLPMPRHPAATTFARYAAPNQFHLPSLPVYQQPQHSHATMSMPAPMSMPMTMTMSMPLQAAAPLPQQHLAPQVPPSVPLYQQHQQYQHHQQYQEHQPYQQLQEHQLQQRYHHREQPEQQVQQQVQQQQQQQQPHHQLPYAPQVPAPVHHHPETVPTYHAPTYHAPTAAINAELPDARCHSIGLPPSPPRPTSPISPSPSTSPAKGPRISAQSFKPAALSKRTRRRNISSSSSSSTTAPNGNNAKGDNNTRGRRTSPNSSLPCDVCNQLYSRKDNLRAHQRVHSGEKPYQCSDCFVKFRWLGALRSHQASHRRRRAAALRLATNAAVAAGNSAAANEDNIMHGAERQESVAPASWSEARSPASMDVRVTALLNPETDVHVPVTAAQVASSLGTGSGVSTDSRHGVAGRAATSRALEAEEDEEDGNMDSLGSASGGEVMTLANREDANVNISIANMAVVSAKTEPVMVVVGGATARGEQQGWKQETQMWTSPCGQ